MSTKFLHGADDIIAKVLEVRLHGTNPAPWEAYFPNTGSTLPTTTWPIFSGGEPGNPDNVITVYETTPQSNAKIMVTGEDQQHYGFTIRVRGRTKAEARQKAEDIRHDANEKIRDIVVTLDGQQYLVPCIPRATLVPVGRETPTSQRWLVNLNCLAAIIAYPIQG